MTANFAKHSKRAFARPFQIIAFTYLLRIIGIVFLP